ncbi:MAG TPA: hypothetical protein VES40_08975 [Ilumatobacteraceae bacterium]|nr:hypothetical protein [Ilumatobacteraceae bacterium]
MAALRLNFRRRHVRVLAATLIAASVLTACATGQRPSFDADQPRLAPTGDPGIDAVLDRLDAVGLEKFTAGYTILTRLGGLESAATVVQADNSRRSVTLNDVRYLDGTGNAATCNLTTDECEAAINDARTSDIQVTHDFYGSSIARRLRVDAGRRLDNARAYESTIAGQTATCADVPVSGGTKIYCALDSGVLARYDGADLAIELVTVSDVPDESLFATN